MKDYLFIAAICALTVFAGVQTSRLYAKERAIADLEAGIAKAREARLAQAEGQREIERLRSRNVAKEMDHAHTQARAARNDAAHLDRAADRLRREVARLSAGQERGDPPTAASSTSVAGSGLVFTDVFGGLDSRLRSCAAALDEARIAGLACERAYDAVSKGAD